MVLFVKNYAKYFFKRAACYTKVLQSRKASEGTDDGRCVSRLVVRMYKIQPTGIAWEHRPGALE